MSALQWRTNSILWLHQVERRRVDGRSERQDRYRSSEMVWRYPQRRAATVGGGEEAMLQEESAMCWADRSFVLEVSELVRAVASQIAKTAAAAAMTVGRREVDPGQMSGGAFCLDCTDSFCTKQASPLRNDRWLRCANSAFCSGTVILFGRRDYLPLQYTQEKNINYFYLFILEKKSAWTHLASVKFAIW